MHAQHPEMASARSELYRPFLRAPARPRRPDAYGASLHFVSATGTDYRVGGNSEVLPHPELPPKGRH